MADILRGNNANKQIDTNLKVSAKLELPIKNDFTGDSAGSIALKSNNLLSYKDNLGNIIELSIGDLSNYALKNSPIFTGIPQAPTASPGTNTNQLATTAFVLANSTVGNLQTVTTTGNFTDRAIQITSNANLVATTQGLALYTGTSSSSTIAYIKGSLIKSSLILAETSSTLTASTITLSGDTTTNNLNVIGQITSAGGLFTSLNVSNVPTSGNNATNKTYVDGLIAGVTYTASNGITKVANNFQLGGALTAPVLIGGSAVNTFTIYGGGSSYFRTGSNSIYIESNFTDTLSYQTILGHSGSLALLRTTATVSGLYSGINVNHQNILFTDQINSKGVAYAGDYSANFTARSLVDKGYVDGLNTGNVKLTGNQTIGGQKTFNTFTSFQDTIWFTRIVGRPNIFDFQDLAGEDAFVWQKAAGGAGQARFLMTNDNIVRDYRLPSSSGTLALLSDLSTKQNTITLTTTGSSGAATLVGSTLNIPNYTGGGSSYTFTRGLTEAAGVVTLGGNTNSAISIATTAASADFTVYNSANPTSTNSSGTLLIANNANSSSDGILLSLSNSAGVKTSLSFKTGSTTFTDNISSKGIVYGADYSANFTARSLVDKGYVDNIAGGTAGTYTPTLSNGTNITASTPKLSHYIRVGNQVHVSGCLDCTSTGSGNSVVYISLPVASNLTVDEDLAGVCSSTGGFGNAGIINAYTSGDQAMIRFGALVGGSGTVYFTFTYTII